MRYLLALAALLLLAGCMAPQYLYYGNTSHSYYKMVKNRDAKAVENYQESLEKVFERSAKSGLKVPPGLYCDYAMLMLSQQKNDLAMQYLQLEKEAWAESEKMVDFLMQRYGLKH